ncbi:anthranilate synthase component I [Subtercola boreus]|uniref:Anthranilate synthase component 1 n=1 Tax=Subtercola boreus TaxID=120213 RepID=A0A3E0WDE3_9MICO|nr:anthranilate synthase component I [Subtercola boreus]RFA21288.1 anthranilate synthase component I [Subtercola boreus]RFA21671.1 anthranilate synthase component I [Subtercola boreus]RFA27728.1 anthranilate synthase component I [Subtercola boreus]
MAETRTTSTTRVDFDDLLSTHRVIPVIRTLFADGETPVGIYRKLSDNRPGTFLLESAAQGGVWSRFSFIGVSSYGVLSAEGDRAIWMGSGLSSARAFPHGMPAGPLEALAELYEEWKTPAIPGHPPLTGGLVGFIGWEAVRQIEHLPDQPPADFAIPSQALSFVSDLIAVDHLLGTVVLVSTVLADAGADTGDDLWRDAQTRLDSMQRRLSKPAEAWLAEADFSLAAAPDARTTRDEFLASIAVAKEHIRDGDIFQVVIAQRFDLECTAEPIDVYRVLRTLNPSPYLYLLNLESPSRQPYAIVGSSPEALVTVGSGRAFTHPIAGSRPRGATVEQDDAFETDLLADPKERAEHLMLVDLARNDLLKVCEAGSVEVTEFMRIERFSHIMHIVSSVEGTLAPDVTAIDVFRATFPAGTLSGAPKPRAMQIIDDLEPAQRGLYGGVVGYFDFAGDADLAIAIRTAVIAEGVARVQAGGGLVADSDPDSEFIESQNKAAAPLRAVAIANAMTRVG